MSSIAITSIVFACVFGGALFGMFLRAALPQHHLTTNSEDVLKLGMALVSTMSALVLGLLISSAKGSYDAKNSELTEMSAKTVLLDRVLAHYGEETKESRELLRASMVRILDRLSSNRHTGTSQMEAPSVGEEVVFDEIQELSPKDDRQRALQTQALSLLLDLGRTRWLQYTQGADSVTVPLLVMLVFWLTTLLISFGLFAPVNGTVVTSLLVSALSVSGAIFLILEMYMPYAGLIKVSSRPLRAALIQLGK